MEPLTPPEPMQPPQEGLHHSWHRAFHHTSQFNANHVDQRDRLSIMQDYVRAGPLYRDVIKNVNELLRKKPYLKHNPKFQPMNEIQARADVLTNRRDLPNERVHGVKLLQRLTKAPNGKMKINFY